MYGQISDDQSLSEGILPSKDPSSKTSRFLDGLRQDESMLLAIAVSSNPESRLSNMLVSSEPACNIKGARSVEESKISLIRYSGPDIRSYQRYPPENRLLVLQMLLG